LDEASAGARAFPELDAKIPTLMGSADDYAFPSAMVCGRSLSSVE